MGVPGLHIRDRVLSLESPVIMGILNVTPDSFSDGGRFAQPDDAIRHAEKMAAEGADIIDIGGESTRPGAISVSETEELSRVIPVVYELAQRGYILSVDTVKPAVAEAALEAGAHIINDISGLRAAPEMGQIAARYSAGYVLMHMQGEPRTMQVNPQYNDIVQELYSFLEDAVQLAVASGLHRENLIIDPGIGFGKNLAHNLTLFRNLEKFTEMGVPVMLGASRKSFIHMISGASVSERLAGSLAAAVYGRLKGVSLFRVHDVAETKQALAVLTALGKEHS